MERKTPFLTLLGESPITKVLDFLVVNEDFDYSMTDIAKRSGVGYATLKLLWPKLEHERVVQHVRTVGKAKIYRLNFSNPLIKTFRDFYWSICRDAVRKELAQLSKRRVLVGA